MNNSKTVGAHAPVVILLAVMAITAPALISLGGKIFPDSPLRQMALVGVSEVGLVLWHIASNHAKGDKQESIGHVMVWVSVIGVAVLAGLDILIESADAKKLPVTFDMNMIGTGLMVSLIGLIIAHLIGAISFMHNDPEKFLLRAAQRAQYAIEAEAAIQIGHNAKTIAVDLANARAKAFMDGQRHETNTRIASQQNAITGNGQIVTSPLVREIPAPAGPSLTAADVAAMIATALRNQQASVTMNADAPSNVTIVEAQDPK